MQAEYGNSLRAANGAPLATTHPRLWQRFSRQYEQLLTLSRRTRRALVRRWGLSLAGIALALTLGLAGPSAAAPSATITVNGTTCTLADAITAANTDTAAGGCTAGSGADTIELAVNLLLDADLPPITDNLTINGNGYAVNGVDTYSCLVIDAAASVTVDNIGIQQCYSANGGAVYNSGSVTITNSTLTGNRAYYYGGAVFGALDSTTTIVNSQISYNATVYLL